MISRESICRAFLRIMGSVSLLALVFVAVPYAWMDAIHQGLGLGRLPDEPIVGYLARSTSAFYAMLGGLLWLASFDLKRHRLLLGYLGAAMVALGLALGAIDWIEGMPLFWKVGEGPIDVAFGIVLVWMSRRIGDFG
jgi:hypothetical protein